MIHEESPAGDDRLDAKPGRACAKPYEMLEDFPEPAYVKDRDRRVVYANKRFRDTFGEPGRRRCYEILFGAKGPCAKCRLDGVFDAGGHTTQKWTYGNRTYYFWEKLLSEQESQPLALTIGVDITELEKALAVKAGFLSMISHELRNPLTPIIGYAEMLHGGSFGALRPEAADAAGVILDRARHMTRLIEDLLSLTKMDRQGVKVHAAPVSAAALARSMAADFMACAHGKPVNITTRGQDCAIAADPLLLRQACRKLLDNAAKFSGDSVEIALETGVRGSMGFIAVSDNGIGIAEEHLPRIFDRFYQAEAVDTRRHDGSGLGLAMAHELIELMSGTLSVESNPGRGSTFLIMLPLAAQRAEDKQRTEAGTEEPAPAPTGRPRILVVDDDEYILAMVRELLAARFEVHTAGDAGSGLEMIRAHGYELALLDWMMPGMDGLALLKALKSDPATAGLPVIFVSGKAEPEAAATALEAGAAAFLPKPFFSRDLFAAIGKALAP